MRRARANLRGALLAAERRANRQEAEPLGGVGLRLHVVRIVDGAAELLAAPAVAERRLAAARPRGERRREASGAQPSQIAGGALRAREDHEIGPRELVGVRHEPHHDARFVLEGLEVVVVRDARQADHGEVEPRRRRADLATLFQRHRVFVGNPQGAARTAAPRGRARRCASRGTRGPSPAAPRPRGTC